MADQIWVAPVIIILSILLVAWVVGRTAERVFNARVSRRLELLLQEQTIANRKTFYNWQEDPESGFEKE